MRAAIVMVGLLILTGCGGKVQDAEKQYRIVSRNGNPAATCTAAQAVAAAALSENDEAKYREWTKSAEGDCAVARLLSR